MATLSAEKRGDKPLQDSAAPANLRPFLFSVSCFTLAASTPTLLPEAQTAGDPLNGRSHPPPKPPVHNVPADLPHTTFPLARTSRTTPAPPPSPSTLFWLFVELGHSQADALGGILQAFCLLHVPVHGDVVRQKHLPMLVDAVD